MQLPLEKIDMGEALRYMGYKGQALDGDTAKQLKLAGEQVLRTAFPRAVWKQLSLLPQETETEKAIGLEGANLRLTGKDIAAHLQGCESCILLCVTLGGEIETLLRKAPLLDRAGALMLDACASAGVETVCDALGKRLAQAYEKDGLFLTSRYSPGYGDLPVTLQRDFCAVLEAGKTLGVCVNEGGLLIPRKSVTAIIGLSKTPPAKHRHSCAGCAGYALCPYRKEGKYCDG